MNRISLRKAGPCDSEFAYCVKRAAFRSYVEQVWGWNEDEQRQFHERHFATQEFQIVTVDGKDVGIVAVDVEPDCVRLNQLFVLPEHQGKGIGRECMSFIIEKARQLHLPVRLRALKVNPRAQEFYKRFGFVHIGDTETHVLMEKGSTEENKGGTFKLV